MIGNDNLISVITPAYNCANTIEETILSVRSQTYGNWEIIIVDDCSKDNTVEIVKQHSLLDDRIKLICLEQNSGSATARNTAINHASGKYIALLDSDDLWKPEKLERQLRFMETHGYAFTFTAYDVFKDVSDVGRRIFEVPKSINYNQYLRNSIIGCLTVMVDKDQIPDFHMESGYLEDVLTWMYYLKHGVVAYGLNENLASYRVSSGSKSAKKIKNAQRYYQCLKQQDRVGIVLRLFSQIGYIYNATKKRLFSKKTKNDCVVYNK